MGSTEHGAPLTSGQMAKALRMAGTDESPGRLGQKGATRAVTVTPRGARLGASITVLMLLSAGAAVVGGTETPPDGADFPGLAPSAAAGSGSIPRPAGAAGGRDGPSAIRQESKEMFMKLTGVTAAAAVGLSTAVAQGQQSAVTSIGDWSAPPSSMLFKSIAASPYANAVGVTPAGELRTWGRNASTSNAPTDAGYRYASVGYSFGIGLKEDGTLRHWGDNSYGQAVFPAGTFKEISCGDWTVAAIRSDGSLAIWGSVSLWGLALPPEGSDYVRVASGNWHHLAIRSGGLVRAWGFNDTGACDVPQDLAARAVAAGWQFSFAARSDGSLTWWGTDHQRAMDGMPREGNFIDVAFNVHEGTGGGIGLRSDGSVVRWPGPNVAAGTYARAITTGFMLVDSDCNGDGIGDLLQIEQGMVSDLNANRVPDTCECLGDLYLDGFVNGADLGALLAYWGPVTGTPASLAADINRDGTVNGSDLGILLASWGTCGG